MKKQLKFENIKVRSFVTDLSKNAASTINGGYDPDYWRASGPWQYCPTNGCTGVNCGSANPC